MVVAPGAAVADASPDTFPRLLLRHAQSRGDAPAMREKDIGIWQSWSWAQVAVEVARHGLRAGRARLQARRPAGHHRRQPPPPVLVDVRRADARRRAGAALPGCGGPGNGLRPARCRHPHRHRRGSGAGGQAAGSARPVPAPGAYPLRRSARHAPLHPDLPARHGRSPGHGSHPQCQSTRLRDPGNRARGRPTTCRSCSTRRAPPASPRGFARPTRPSSPRRAVAWWSIIWQPTAIFFPTCRWPGLATTCFPMPRRWSRDSPSTVRSPAKR